MKLDIKDRYIITNQLKILEALYPNESKSYAIQRMAFESGYEAHYSEAMNDVSEDVLSEKETKEVKDTLDMFCKLGESYRLLSNKTGIDKYNLRFAGYDANNQLELQFMGYAKYLVEEKNKYKEILKDNDKSFDFNSHEEKREMYLRMLEAWNRISKGQNIILTREEIIEITEASVHPRNR